MDNKFYYECWSGTHKGGTKFYTMHYFRGPDGFFSIWQFGKIGTFGTLNFHRGHGDSNKFRFGEFEAKLKQRMNSDYAMTQKVVIHVDGVSDLYGAAGRVLMQKILAEQTDWFQEIDADFNRQMFVPKNVSEKIDREGQAKLLAEMQRQSDLREERVRDAEIEEMKKNPLFGMF